MQNEIKIGDFYRTAKGLIRQVKAIKSGKRRFTRTTETLINGVHKPEDIVKHSKNIIDLIEVGDYVNGERVLCFRNNDCDYDIGTEYNDEFGEYFGFDLESIKSIVTKEQFANMEYKVGM